MKITDIKQQEKNKNRYSIYVDGKYKFSLSGWQLRDSNLKVSGELSAQDYEKYQKDTDFGKLYDRTLNWLSIRPRSIGEINKYLNRKTDDKKIAQRIFAKLSDMNLIDDEKFARSWVESRRLTRNYSKLRIEQELRLKQVDKSIINAVLTEDETSDLATIKQIISKKRKKYPDDQKLMAYLARQGFNYGDIKQGISESE